MQDEKKNENDTERAAQIFADIFLMQMDSLADVALPSLLVVGGKPAGSTSTTHTGGRNRHDAHR